MCRQRVLGVPHHPRDFHTSNVEEIYGGQGYCLLWSRNQKGPGDAGLLQAHRHVSGEPAGACCDSIKHLQQRNTITMHLSNYVL